MCFSSPKTPAAPVAPPPPAPITPPVLGKEEDSVDVLKKKKLGYSRLQIPLVGSSSAPAPASGLNAPA